MISRALNEALQRLLFVLRWAAIAGVIGVFAGLTSAAFIESLNWAADARADNDLLLWFLPVAGLAIGLLYHYVGRGLERGSNLIVEQLHGHTEWIPFKLAPLVFLCSVIGHVFGASVGREGAAVQLSAGLADPMAKIIRLDAHDRTIALTAAIAGGFGAVFGVPFAGTIFALEIRRIGRIDYAALVPAFIASVVGDAVVRGIGVHHTAYPQLSAISPFPRWSWTLGLQLTFVGIACGLVALLFVQLTHAVRALHNRWTPWYPLRPLFGGIIIVALTMIFAWREYAGLSLPIALDAMNGDHVVAWLPKLLLTAVAIGSGFVGGEVIPLFVLGALVGGAVGNLVDVNTALSAEVGAVALLGAAGNVPLACTVMGVELFGGNAIAMIALTCIVAYMASGHSGIYHAQHIGAHKSGNIKYELEK